MKIIHAMKSCKGLVLELIKHNECDGFIQLLGEFDRHKCRMLVDHIL